MIVVIVPNPSLDKTVILPDFAVGRIYRPEHVTTLAGGKGFNFARALHTLGQQSLVLALAGGYGGQLLMKLAQQEGLACEKIAVEAELRTCLTIIDPSADYRVTELYEWGASLEVGAWDRLVAGITHHLPQADFLAICGSFLPETPTKGLYDLMTQARSESVPVLLDTYGPQVVEALELAPALLKINQFEAGELVGQSLSSPVQALDGAAELQRRGAQAVVITLGKQGAVGITADGQSFAWAAPEVVALCATGSGDCLFAGIASSLMKGWSLPDAVRMGIAAGAANTLQIGAGQFDFAQVQRLFEIVQPLSL